MTTKVLGATALALLVGISMSAVGIAAAQNGGEARSNDRALQKTLDDKHLTPIRPIRRVGPDGWPAAKDPTPTNLPPETTGQSASNNDDSAEPDDAKRDTAQQDTKPAQRDTAQQGQAAKQDSARNQPAPPQDTAKKNTAKQEPKPQQPSQDRQQAQQPATRDTKQQDSAGTGRQPNENQGNQQAAKSGKDQDKDKGFASIRLGTDKDGRVAVNDAQERQITKALRKHDIKTFDVDVRIGAPVPANVRLGAVSADLVAVLPQFRGYSFFATRDQIVIVEPDSNKVVALVPVKLTATASKPREERTTSRETTATRKSARKERTREVTVGRGVPSEAEILAAPVVTAPAGTVVTRSYRYRLEEPETVIIERRQPRLFGLW